MTLQKIKAALFGAMIAAAGFFGTPAKSQAGSSCQYITTGAVLTAAQWNSCFQAKQNELGYTPINKAGDGMLGILTTIAPTTSTAGFRLYPGVAPSAPTNGDLWTTSAGLYVRINGATVGPLRDSTSGSFAGTSPITVSFPSSVVTYACPTCVTSSGGGAITGTAPISVSAAGVVSLDANGVTYAKFQQVAASSLVGNPTVSLATSQGITLGSTLAFSGTALQTGAGTGDVAWSANSFVTTLATVNSNVGTFGSSTAIPVITINGKGLVTAVTTAAVVAPAGTLSGATLAANVLASSLTSVGTLTGGATGAGFTIALTTSTVTGTLPAAQFPALTGDVTTSAGVLATTIAANAVTNAKAAQMAAYTFKGNVTGSTANATDFTMASLTQKVSPAAGDLVMIADSAASNATKYALVSSIASAGSVSSIAGNTGAFTISGLLSNSTNDLRVTAAAQSDQETATSTILAVTPGRQQYHPSAAKAWARWNGTTAGTNAPTAGFNVTSVTRNSAGNYTVNFTTAFSASTAYGCTVTSENNAGSGVLPQIITSSYATGSVGVQTLGTTFAASDAATVTAACFGDQ